MNSNSFISVVGQAWEAFQRGYSATLARYHKKNSPTKERVKPTGARTTAPQEGSRIELQNAPNTRTTSQVERASFVGTTNDFPPFQDKCRACFGLGLDRGCMQMFQW